MHDNWTWLFVWKKLNDWYFVKSAVQQEYYSDFGTHTYNPEKCKLILDSIPANMRNFCHGLNTLVHAIIYIIHRI